MRRGWWGAAGLAILCVALLGGCVTRGTYRQVEAERDLLRREVRELRERVEKLEASNRSLSAERVKLLEEVEDLRQEQASLEQSVRALRRTKQELEAHLKAREKELASYTQELARLQGTYESLVEDLEREVAAGQIQIEQLRKGLRLNLSDEILFPSGSARLTPQGREVLKKVAARLREVPHRIEVQGHTDNVPIRGRLAERYPSNWELAAERATEVVRLLESEGVDPRRLTAVSYGEYRPVAPNDTPEGRALNRRIEIRLIPEEGQGAASPAG